MNIKLTARGIKKFQQNFVREQIHSCLRSWFLGLDEDCWHIHSSLSGGRASISDPGLSQLLFQQALTTKSGQNAYIIGPRMSLSFPIYQHLRLGLFVAYVTRCTRFEATEVIYVLL